MSKIVRETFINAPREQVWEKALLDFGNIQEWNPNVVKSYTTNDVPHGLNAARHCDLGGGSTIEERVLQWEDNKMMKILIAEGTKTPPWKNPTAKIELFDANGGTKARMTFEYQMKLGPIGYLMDRFMIQPQFGKALDALMVGMKYFIENGRKATTNQLDLSQAVMVPA